MKRLSKEELDSLTPASFQSETVQRLILMAREAVLSREALADIKGHAGKTRLADCCVNKTCTPHTCDGDVVGECAYQYGVFDGFSELAYCAEEALTAADALWSEGSGA